MELTKKHKFIVYIFIWLVIVIIPFFVLGAWVYRIDPFFHYHKPNTDAYFYVLDNQRSQNDGICRHFDYDALITGTSMTENFKTSEMDDLFNCNSIKVSYSGGSYKEINECIEKAMEYNPNIRIVVRGLDMDRFSEEEDTMRNDLGTYPKYLYDNNPFNDLEYLLNKDVIFQRTYEMTKENNSDDFHPGITSFDEYSNWQNRFTYGINSICPKITETYIDTDSLLSEEELYTITSNIKKNVTDVADKYPNVDFYYFYTPYSIIWWAGNRERLNKQIAAEELVTELILKYQNIHLFSFNTRFDIIQDLNNYKDSMHYATWINSLILKWMSQGKYELTLENYKEYLQNEQDFLASYNYSNILSQKDYEADYYAAALLNEEFTDTKPIDILNNPCIDVQINGAEYLYCDGNIAGISCHGFLNREPESDDLALHLKDVEYIGIKFNVNLDDGYNYLSFYGQKITNQGCPTVYVFDEKNTVVGEVVYDYSIIDNSIHQYVIDLSKVSGNVTIILNGGYKNYTGASNSEYTFSKIILF